MKKKVLNILNKVFGPALLIALSYNIYKQINGQSQLSNAFDALVAFNTAKLLLLFLVIVLMLLSFFIEAYKWKLLVNPFQQITMLTAVKNIFTGQAFAFTSINDVGDFVGRVMHFKENKIKLAALNFFASFSQVLIIVGFGLIATFYNFNLLLDTFSLPKLIAQLILIGASFAMFFFIYCFYNVNKALPWLNKFRYTKWLYNSLSMVKNVHVFVLTKLLVFSFFKYVVYTIQYLLILKICNVEGSMVDIMAMVSFFLLALTVIPSIAFAELGIRGQLALVLFGILSSNQLAILIATVLIWFINRVLPAIIGTVFVTSIKLKQ